MSDANKAARARQAPPRVKGGGREHASAECMGCGERKLLTEFHKNGTGHKYAANDRRRYKKTCAQCLRTVSAAGSDPAFMADRKKARKARAAERTRQSNLASKARLRRRTRIACLKYLAKQGCDICGEMDPRVLEFDHLEPCEKVHHIATLISGGYSWSSEVLRREIRKCRILCANCHRKHTIEQQDYYSHPQVSGALDEILRDLGIKK